MGFITSFLCYFIPGVGVATYYSFRLGPQLPIACRKMGYYLRLLVITHRIELWCFQSNLENQFTKRHCQIK
ncbi:unnamed protein product [Paramecium sonneborni]|uniref:Uncharacterized protein n=1 Tax=Paramecium sonneborni TaxID=65129 RepID=A0A8S1M094_9CILI|nr:unnamed protein product [Paramecium sonneborni]